MEKTVKSWLSRYTMNESAREIVNGMSDNITRAECVKLGAQLFAAEHFAYGSIGTRRGNICIGVHVFALFPFPIINAKQEERFLTVIFSYRSDGMTRLSRSAKQLCLIRGGDFMMHKYAVENELTGIPRSRIDLSVVLSNKELEDWILDHRSV